MLGSTYKDIKCIDVIYQCLLKTDCLTAKWSPILKLMFLNLLRTNQADTSYYMNNNACVCSIWTKVPSAPSQRITTVIRIPIPSNIIAHKFKTGSLLLDLLEWWLHIRQQAHAWLNTWSSHLWNKDRKKKKHGCFKQQFPLKHCKKYFELALKIIFVFHTTVTLTKRQRVCAVIFNLKWSTYRQSIKTVCRVVICHLEWDVAGLPLNSW